MVTTTLAVATGEGVEMDVRLCVTEGVEERRAEVVRLVEEEEREEEEAVRLRVVVAAVESDVLASTVT